MGKLSIVAVVVTFAHVLSKVGNESLGSPGG